MNAIQAGRKVRDLQKRLAQAKTERDSVILTAWVDGGQSMTEIAEQVGLSRQQVFNILSRYADMTDPATLVKS